MLTQTLREMERDGLLTRTIHEAVPPHVEYALTALGQRFEEPLAMLYDWARANVEALDELDRIAVSEKRRKAGRDPPFKRQARTVRPLSKSRITVGRAERPSDPGSTASICVPKRRRTAVRVFAGA